MTTVWQYWSINEFHLNDLCTKIATVTICLSLTTSMFISYCLQDINNKENILKEIRNKYERNI